MINMDRWRIDADQKLRVGFEGHCMWRMMSPEPLKALVKGLSYGWNRITALNQFLSPFRTRLWEMTILIESAFPGKIISPCRNPMPRGFSRTRQKLSFIIIDAIDF
jgi:hypothetical protein